jgi:hypothetical protein
MHWGADFLFFENVCRSILYASIDRSHAAKERPSVCLCQFPKKGGKKDKKSTPVCVCKSVCV